METLDFTTSPERIKSLAHDEVPVFGSISAGFRDVVRATLFSGAFHKHNVVQPCDRPY